jgi:hydroxymethylpyrimidine pyrophosphatase-like HAD family hydrolase
MPEWTSVAMGNGVPELKARASYVTSNADDDGIYKACRHFGWI